MHLQRRAWGTVGPAAFAGPARGQCTAIRRAVNGSTGVSPGRAP